jgi:hypothetical protein
MELVRLEDELQVPEWMAGRALMKMWEREKNRIEKKLAYYLSIVYSEEH